MKVGFGFFSYASKPSLADKWTSISSRVKAENGIPVLETTLSLTTSAKEYLLVILRHVDALYRHYSRPDVRKWRFDCHCVRQGAPSNISDELLTGCEDVVASITKDQRGRKIEAKKAESGPSPSFLDYFTDKFLTSPFLGHTTLC